MVGSCGTAIAGYGGAAGNSVCTLSAHRGQLPFTGLTLTHIAILSVACVVVGVTALFVRPRASA